MAEGFIHYTLDYANKANEYAKEEMFNLNMMINANKTKLSKLIHLFDRDDLEETKFKKIKNIAFKIIPKDLLKILGKVIAKEQIDKNEF